MFKVECPECSAPYQVDERRVPTAGVNMRCPKCRVSFVVHKPGDEPNLPDARSGSSSTARASQDSTTMLGVAAPVQPKAPPPRPTRERGDAAKAPPRPAIPRPAGAPPPPRRGAKPPLRPQLSAKPHVANDVAPDSGLPDSEPGLPASMSSSALQAARIGAALPSLPSMDIDDEPGLPETPASSRPSLPSRSDSNRPSLPVSANARRPSLPSVLASPSEAPFGADGDTSDFDLAFDEAPDGQSSLPPALGGMGAPSERPRTPSVPHPGIAQRPSVPRPEPTTSSEGSGELPPPREPAVGDSVIPLTDSDIGSLRPASDRASEPPTDFSLDGSLELPSPAADFEEELARGLEPEDPGDFGIPSASGSGMLASELGAGSGRTGIEPSAPDGVVIEDALPFDPGSLPELPDLDGRPSSRPRAAATVLDRSHTSGEFEDDMFTLDSRPPSKAPPAAKAPSSGSFDAGGLDDDDLFGGELTGNSTSDVGSFGDAGAGEFGAGIPSARSSDSEYGEVSLPEEDDAGDGGFGDSLDLGDDAEFGAIPQEERASGDLDGDGAPGQPHRPHAAAHSAAHAHTAMPSVAPPPAMGASSAEKAPANKGKWALVFVLVSAMAGGALALVPDVGPFGMYFISDLMNRDAHDALLDDTAKQVLALSEQDSYTGIPKIVAACERARATAPRFDALTAYQAFAQYAAVARFGGQPELQANAKVLLDGLIASGVESDVPYFLAAQAAQAVVLGDAAGAKRSLSSAYPKGVWLEALHGELLIRTGPAEEAVNTWTKAVSSSPSAWTLAGLARAELASGHYEEAATHAKKALEQNPDHIGARYVLASVANHRGEDAAALEAIDEVLERRNLASPEEAVLVQTLLGEMHLHRGRLSKAEAAFTLALETDPKATRASVGLGDTHYDAGRYATALSRYEIAASAGEPPLAASLGIAKCQLALDRIEKAREVLASLQEKHGKEPAVAYWTGKLAAASGAKEKAEASYGLAMAEGAPETIFVNSAVSLGQLLSQSGKADDAHAVLKEAQKRFPKSVLLRNSMGEVALAQGRYEQALQDFRAAKALDSADVTAVFNEGSALRRLKRFDEAWGVFEEVAKLDKDLPGLPLERGLLLEQSGKSEAALKEYELALAKNPDDPDLKLRTGCGRVAVGEGKAAEKILLEVLKQRSRVAEAHHCLGRAIFLQGRNVEALKRLQEATTLDSNRAEYHMYVGWVANEAGQVELAKRSLNTALSIDQGLADAYWQRGVLSLRQGGAGDAIIDIQKALSMRPSRYEAHADLAQAYYQMGRMQDALRHWQQALAADGDNATWQFRFGKLLHNQHRNAEAANHLERAIELSAKEDSPPTWLWEAHHLAASSLGANPKALTHWKKFLELGPRDSPYRTDAKRALRNAGQPWHGN